MESLLNREVYHPKYKRGKVIGIIHTKYIVEYPKSSLKLFGKYDGHIVGLDFVRMHHSIELVKEMLCEISV